MSFNKKIKGKYVLADSMDTITAAGGIFYAKDSGKICVARRGGLVPQPYTWATWGGKLDKGETPEVALKREIAEEAGYIGAYKLEHVYTSNDPNLVYDTYWIVVDKEFDPKLNWENVDFRWCTLDTIPQPTHPGLKVSLPHLKRTKPKD